ncbi:MAG: sigma-70 family RNA polymerase sigma factor [Phycisphaerales bacterium]|nr:sigma-70 family RNA polymerase sigma factor [Phycisphaerales bacterium]
MPHAAEAPPEPKPLAAGDDTEALTRAIARGDTRAFGVLYERWFDRLLAAARLITGRDEAFCLDTVQDAMLKAAKRIPTLPSEAALDRWLCRVVHRAALDRLRRERRRVAREGRHAPGAGLPASGLDEHLAWLRERLRELPPQDRHLLAARFARARTFEQIGEETGSTPGAAHGRIRRLIHALRVSEGDQQ